MTQRADSASRLLYDSSRDTLMNLIHREAMEQALALVRQRGTPTRMEHNRSEAVAILEVAATSLRRLESGRPGV